MAALEALLLTMTAHGKPSVSLTSQGWHCGVDMTVPHTGVAVTVRSGFDHLTPLEAAQVCMDRIQVIASKNARLGHG